MRSDSISSQNSLSLTKKIAVAALMSIFYAYQYVFRVLPSISVDHVMLKFGVDAAAFSQFSGIYYIGYSLAHIPVGLMLDSIGPKKVIPSCMLIIVLGTLPLAFIDDWSLTVFGRFMIGVGSSAAALGLMKVVGTYFKKNFGGVFGAAIFIGLCGACFGGPPMASLVSSFGLDIVCLVASIIGVILAAFLFVVLPEEKSKFDRSNLKDVFKILSNKKLIMIGLFAGFLVGPLEGFADVWGPKFFQTVQNCEAGKSTYFSSIIFIGMGIGSFLLGLIGDKTKKYYQIVMYSAVVMFLSFISIMMFNIAFAVLVVISFAIGIASAYQVSSLTIAMRSVKNELVGITGAFINMILMSFGYIFHTGIGMILKMNEADGFVNSDGVQMYTVSAFNKAIAIIPIAIVLGFAGFMILSILNKKEDRLMEKEEIK